MTNISVLQILVMFNSLGCPSGLHREVLIVNIEEWSDGLFPC